MKKLLLLLSVIVLLLTCKKIVPILPVPAEWSDSISFIGTGFDNDTFRFKLPSSHPSKIIIRLYVSIPDTFPTLGRNEYLEGSIMNTPIFAGVPNGPYNRRLMITDSAFNVTADSAFFVSLNTTYYYITPKTPYFNVYDTTTLKLNYYK